MEVREVVDPSEMVTDWFNAIHWAMGEPMVDKNRIGLRGSSYSGGHVVHVAARSSGESDCQPGGLARFAAEGGCARGLRPTRWLGPMKKRPRTSARRAWLSCAQEWWQSARRADPRQALLYAPVEDAAALKNCAALFIVARRKSCLTTTITQRWDTIE
jgi:dienelactone hydrolase